MHCRYRGLRAIDCIGRRHGCDFDRLQTMADEMTNVRLMLGHDQFTDNTRYDMQTLVSNVALLTPELLQSINQLVIEEGHSLVGKEPGDALRGRCDSFVVETDVHFPTDVWSVFLPGCDALPDSRSEPHGKGSSAQRLAAVEKTSQKGEEAVQPGEHAGQAK